MSRKISSVYLILSLASIDAGLLKNWLNGADKENNFELDAKSKSEIENTYRWLFHEYETKDSIMSEAEATCVVSSIRKVLGANEIDLQYSGLEFVRLTIPEPSELPSEPNELPGEPNELPGELNELPSEPNELPSEPNELPKKTITIGAYEFYINHRKSIFLGLPRFHGAHAFNGYLLLDYVSVDQFEVHSTIVDVLLLNYQSILQSSSRNVKIAFSNEECSVLDVKQADTINVNDAINEDEPYIMSIDLGPYDGFSDASTMQNATSSSTQNSDTQIELYGKTQTEAGCSKKHSRVKNENRPPKPPKSVRKSKKLLSSQSSSNSSALHQSTERNTAFVELVHRISYYFCVVLLNSFLILRNTFEIK